MTVLDPNGNRNGSVMIMTKIEDAINEWWAYAKRTSPERTAIAQLKRDYTEAGHGSRRLAAQVNIYSDTKVTAAGLLAYLKKKGLKTEPKRFKKSTKGGKTVAQLEAELREIRDKQRRTASALHSSEQIVRAGGFHAKFPDAPRGAAKKAKKIRQDIILNPDIFRRGY